MLPLPSPIIAEVVFEEDDAEESALRAAPCDYEFVTYHDVYRCRGGRCISVRSLETGAIRLDHPAFGAIVAMALRGDEASGPDGRTALASEACAGDRLCFFHDELLVVTTPLIAIERAPTRTVRRGD